MGLHAGEMVVGKTRKIIIDGEIKTVEYAKENSTANTNFQVPGQDTNIGMFAGLTVIYNLYDEKKEYLEENAKTNVAKIDLFMFFYFL